MKVPTTFAISELRMCEAAKNGAHVSIPYLWLDMLKETHNKYNTLILIKGTTYIVKRISQCSAMQTNLRCCSFEESITVAGIMCKGELFVHIPFETFVVSVKKNTCVSRCLKSLANRLFNSFLWITKRKSKLGIIDPLWGNPQGNPPIIGGFASQRTQWCGKHFHGMTSSWWIIRDTFTSFASLQGLMLLFTHLTQQGPLG